MQQGILLLSVALLAAVDLQQLALDRYDKVRSLLFF
jgi:hypothetical protein